MFQLPSISIINVCELENVSDLRFTSSNRMLVNSNFTLVSLEYNMNFLEMYKMPLIKPWQCKFKPFNYEEMLFQLKKRCFFPYILLT